MPDVSIHAPARGATRDFLRRVLAIMFQSTRPRGARPSSYTSSAISTIVSIHAPARGATVGLFEKAFLESIVSIHAPARGATTRRSSAARPCRGFNPRAREGRDYCRPRRKMMDMPRFQSTRPRGARPRRKRILRPRWWFQSTRPRGARHRTEPTWPYFGESFNPRAREGRDGVSPT